MKVKEAITLFQSYQRSNLKERTQRSYTYVLDGFGKLFGDRELQSIGAEEMTERINLLSMVTGMFM